MRTYTSNPRLIYFRRSTWILLSLTALTLSVVYGAESVQDSDNFRRWVHVGTGVVMPDALPESNEEYTTSLRIRKQSTATRLVISPMARSSCTSCAKPNRRTGSFSKVSAEELTR